MRRISVIGTSGSGKTTLAQQISQRLRIPHVELDAVHHLPDWEPMPAPEFRTAVAERIDGDAWVVDGNYRRKLASLVWERADTVIWLDLPRALVMAQIIRRTLRRMYTREELWNGNRERWRNLFSLDPHQSIIAWAWTTHAPNRTEFLTAQADPANQHLEFIRLRSRREIADFVRGLG